ncbi:MAG TPA: 2-oxoglutarate dehydrogenase E1 component, partial [Verrucomicrobiae bacterium]|nr:2-oxoglutarate dehydrogenase E1 component [Verrucomicrobiae bacterium]
MTNILNLAFLERLYADYLRDRSSVSPEWQQYFEAFRNGEDTGGQASSRASSRFSIFNPPQPGAQATPGHLQDRVDQLIRSYRSRGHVIARVNPLGFPKERPQELDPAFYGLQPEHMDQVFSCETVDPAGPQPLRRIVDKLVNTYCRAIGVEYMHIEDRAVRRWLQGRMEPSENRCELSREEQLRIFTRLTDAVSFEEFIRKKFVGAKTFSLEGSESLIPLLALAIEKAGDQGVQEIVLGMAHRGRLNVLANIMRKSARQIFREFADRDPKVSTAGGDVKYHLGHSTDWHTTSGRKIHLSLCFNPSHLEYVNPVAVGRTRAKQDRVNDRERVRGMALLIHGDAAFAAEGVTQETLNLSQLNAYTIGGTLHVIVNNQIGFTTSPAEARSTTYATDVAKMLQIPIFHVNGEDPEAVAQAVRLAMDFRAQFKRDVVIDMYGYRRLGHNETDEPSFTQPLLYEAIRKRKSVREGYLEHLLKLGGLSREEAEEIARARQEQLEKELSASESLSPLADERRGIWAGYFGGPEPKDKIHTGVPKDKLKQLLEKQTALPKDFHPHPKIKKFLELRLQMAREETPLDWTNAEALAFASLAVEGTRIRLSGQDTARGTFTQRHAVFHDYKNGAPFMPLAHLEAKQAPVEIYNSPLSEIGVLGFEYGYSLDYPDALVMWEAQFGDFVNAAQVIIDQFLASAEEKWRRLSGLVLLLPHGFEGAGPEHSSARMERFLELAANDNLQVVYPTTPAQYFHVLRRQALRRWRKPLVIMTPKSLLRHPKSVSSLNECATGHFETVLPDPRAPASVRRVLLCSGKVYFDLLEKQREDVAILRLEQLYPLRNSELEQAFSPYSKDAPVVWVQEEPENMGAWRFLRIKFGDSILGRRLQLVSRPTAASPATGSSKRHKSEQSQLISAAYDG